MNPEPHANNTDGEASSGTHEEPTSLVDGPLKPQQQQHTGVTKTTTATTTTATATAGTPDMKRSAVKELIERYFYQLQRGCGNPKCTNANCASSGQVAVMTPNEIAAKAIQLFSQDAKLCDYNSQPPKVPRTQNDSPTSSRAIGQRQNADMLSPNENSMSSSSSGHSTITSGSSKSTTSSGSSSSSSSSSSTSSAHSTNTNISSCATEEAPLLELLSGNATTTMMATTTTGSDKAATAKATQSNSMTTAAAAGKTSNATVPTNNVPNELSATPPPPPTCSSTPTLTPILYLDEQIIDQLLEQCAREQSYGILLHAINEVYSSVERLSNSYCRPPASAAATAAAVSGSVSASKLQELLDKPASELKKEDLRTLEGENDKDEDSTCSTMNEEALQRQPSVDSDFETAMQTESVEEPMEEDELAGVYLRDADDSGGGGSIQSQSSDTLVDLESLRRVKKKLFDLNSAEIGEVLNSNIILLAEIIRYKRDVEWERVVHCLVICFDMATNTSNRFADLEYLERSLPKLCHAARMLPVAARARLARIWAYHCKDQLHSLVQCCQQLITLQVILDEDNVQENNDVIAVTKVLKIAFFANILAGQLDKPRLGSGAHGDVGDSDASSSSGGAGIGGVGNTNTEEDDIFFYAQVPKPHYPKFAEDKLEKELSVSSMDCRVPLVPYEEFYNEPLSDAIQMDRDYLSYRNLSLDPTDEDAHFSFMLYSFILTPATKVIALYYDSRIRMYSERSSSQYAYALQNFFGDIDSDTRPELKLKVRRDNIIDDALIGLELVAMSNPKDLKKQLVVEFVGEQGIDEGGVSKEFFQLIVEEIFNPDFGMFTHQEDTSTVWFNSTPFENEAQFTLIGIILGLAIYNNIILAVNFPMVVYRKLMGGQGTFYDLADWNPTLYRSLKSLLDYEEPDIEEVFMQTFKISYMNVFGEMVEHELKSGGNEISVGQHNKQEFVDLYSDFLLNRNIERQFRAFKKGFEMVTDESPLKLLFRPEEIELLVCGSRKFDFVELENSTEYEGGYTKDTQIIKDFWEIVHAMPEDSKRKLLEFTTGSDRVPVGGLSRLKLLITRHGPDSDRLPTSHTCFNVLLLPEYSNKEKLEERLLKAINYSKGFGMI